jgi:hypothetical protein
MGFSGFPKKIGPLFPYNIKIIQTRLSELQKKSGRFLHKKNITISERKNA